jgi:Mg-chelatase subunit ChlD
VPYQSRLVDVALVIDKSGSMKGRKLDDAKTAATTFVELLGVEQNQAALVSFAHEAQIDSPLSHDLAAITGAIDALANSNGSDIAGGIQAADMELGGGRHNPDAAPVLILLSDGRSDEPEAVRAAANAAKTRGVQVVAIGFGKDANEELLRAIVSSPADFYAAPSSADLAAIYEAIAEVIDVCPS